MGTSAGTEDLPASRSDQSWKDGELFLEIVLDVGQADLLDLFAIDTAKNHGEIRSPRPR